MRVSLPSIPCYPVASLMSASTALVLVPQPPSSALAPAAARAQEYFRAAQAENTRRAYASDWKHFSAWCRAAGQGSLPAAPETLVLYLSMLAETAKVSTLTRRISAISQAHQAAGLETPTAHIVVRKLMAGIRRQKGTAQTGKRPLATADLRAPRAARLPAHPGRARPGPAAGGIRRRLPPLRAGGPGRHRPGVQQRGPDRKYPPLQDRPGRAGKTRGASLWVDAGNLPGARHRSLAGGAGRRPGTPVPRDQPARAARRAPPYRAIGGAGDQASGNPGRHGGQGSGRPFAARRPGHRRRLGRRPRTRHHGPNRPPLARDPAQVYPRRIAVPGERGGQSGALRCACSFRAHLGLSKLEEDHS